ncbi:hypothetical protein ABPG73_021919 [Tetrahymena malaccensis]
MENSQITQDTTLQKMEQIKTENMDFLIKQEDLTGQANDQCRFSQFEVKQQQNYYNIFNNFEMNFQIDEYGLQYKTKQSINTHNLNSDVCKQEEQEKQNDTLPNQKENDKQVKIEEQQIAVQDCNKEDQQYNKIQVLQEFVEQKCLNYSNEFQNIKQLHRQMKNNPKITEIINEIRNPIILHYQALLDNQTKKPKNSQRESRKDITKYINEQYHCMCSLNAKFTKLSSLHNHIKKHHNKTPVWCWQLKLSFQVGRPFKDIPKIEPCNNQKKPRYLKKLERLQQMMK